MKKAKTQLKKEQLIAEKSNSINWIYLLLGLFTFLIFANTLSNGYNLDDEIVTQNHPLTSQGIKAIGEIFSSPYYEDDMGYSYGYRPIVHVSFAIEHQLFGENPQISHFFNVILYVLSVLFFFRFLHKLLGDKYLKIIVLAVIIFSIHPVHTEVVASIKNRDEILGFLFAIISANCLITFLQTNNTNWLVLFYTTFFFLLAMLSKKSIYPLVLVFPLSLFLISSLRLNKFLLILIALVLPGAIVASDMKWKIFILLSFATLSFGIFSFYILRLLKEKSISILLKELFKNKFFLTISIFIIVILSVYFKNQWLVFLAFPFFFLLIINYQMLGIIVFSIAFLLFNFLFRQFEYTILSVIIPSLYLFQQLKEKAFIKHALIINIVMLIVALALETSQSGFDSGVFAKYFAFIFFLILRNFRLWFSIVLVPIAFFIFGDLENGKVDFFLLSLLIISIYDIVGLIRKVEVFNFLLISLCFAGFFINLIQQQKKMPIEYSYKTLKSVNTNQADTQYQGEGRALNYIENTLVNPHSPSENIATGIYTLGEYLRLMVFPNELSFYYGFSKIKTTDFTDWKVILSLLFHLGLIVLAIWRFKKQPLISIGLFWYFVSILLFSNWVEFVAGMVGERLAFTASAGFSIFVAALVFWLKPDFTLKKPRIIELIVVTVLLFFSIKTINRNRDWKDAVTLMSKDIKHLQNSAQANNLLALKLASFADSQQDENTRKIYFKKAKKHFENAFTIYPKFANAYYDFARTAMILGENNDAIFGLKKSIQYNPSYNQSYLLLCEYYEMNKNANEMKIVASQWVRNAPEEAAYIALCKSYILNKERNKAKNILIKGQTLFPKGNQIAVLIKDFDLVFKE